MLGPISVRALPKCRRLYSSQPQKILVVGGNGYVGSAISRAAVESGLSVSTLSRSGAILSPKLASEDWAKKVEWIKGDVLDRQWKSHLTSEFIAVISTVGAFGSNEFMEKICGDTNIAACEEAAAAGVPRFVFISAHDYQWIGHGVGPLKGYFNGKRRAEKRVLELYPKSGYILRPSFIYGTRHHGDKTIPLWLAGAPLATLCSLPPIKALGKLPLLDLPLTSPVPLEGVARLAVKAAKGEVSKPILDVDDILKA